MLRSNTLVQWLQLLTFYNRDQLGKWIWFHLLVSLCLLSSNIPFLLVIFSPFAFVPFILPYCFPFISLTWFSSILLHQHLCTFFLLSLCMLAFASGLLFLLFYNIYYKGSPSNGVCFISWQVSITYIKVWLCCLFNLKNSAMRSNRLVTIPPASLEAIAVIQI